VALCGYHDNKHDLDEVRPHNKHDLDEVRLQCIRLESIMFFGKLFGKYYFCSMQMDILNKYRGSMGGALDPPPKIKQSL